jgi:hypothetical protein
MHGPYCWRCLISILAATNIPLGEEYVEEILN